MPGFDGTGPRGLGPKTGRQRGICTTDGATTTPQQPTDTPTPVGRGFGGGRGLGRGRRHRMW